MNNLTAVTNLCTAMCSSFYPDTASVNVVLFNVGIDPDAEAQPKDKAVFKSAVTLVMGYVEASRSEGGISVSVNTGAVEDAIKFWCNEYGVAVDEVLSDSLRTVEDGSHLW